MTIYRHPDGTYRRYPFREQRPELKPDPYGRPNWFVDHDGKPVYVDPDSKKFTP